MRRMRGSWDSSEAGATVGGLRFEDVDSTGEDAASGVVSDGVMEAAEMAVGIAMGFRVLKIHGAELINDRCWIYLESTSVV